MDTNFVSLCRRAEDVIFGSGIIEGVEGVICEDATHSLVSASQVGIERGANVILDSEGAVAVISDDYLKHHVNCIKTNSLNTNQLILTVAINNDSPYVLNSPHIPVVSQHTSTMDPIPLPTSDVSCGMERPATAMKTYTAQAGFYNTAEFQTHRDLVRFFHEAWDHPSRELMCKIVDEKVFDNIPAEMMSKHIRKHFPHCEACLTINMAP